MAGRRADGTNPRALGTNPRATDSIGREELSVRELKLLFEADYARYRRTKHWRRLRAAARRRSNGRCENPSCRVATKYLDTHHLTYERVGEERLEDLQALCRDCHGARHRKLALTGCVMRDSQTGEIVGIVTEIEVELWEPLRRVVVQNDLPQEETKLEDGGLEEGTVERVWAHYCDVFEPRDGVLHAEERKIIRDALKVATPDECCEAIDGNRASDFHQGKNDRGKRYNRISHILKGKRGVRTTREQIDLFIDLLGDRGKPTDSRVRQAMLDVRQAATYRGNRVVQERGARARELLEAAGWTVVETVDGRLDFRRA